MMEELKKKLLDLLGEEGFRAEESHGEAHHL